MDAQDNRDRWFRAVVEAYTSRLLLFLARYPLDGWTSPEDVLQDVLVAAVAAFESGTLPSEEPHLGRWMYAKAKEKGAEAVRRRRRRGGLRKQWTEWRRWTGGATVFQPNRADSIGRAAARNAIMLAVEELPGLQARVLYLRVVEERPFRDIAEEVGRSLSTVSTSHYRALDHLRKSLAPDELEMLRGLLSDSDRSLDEALRRTVRG